ncbi:hypothetical protein B296_00003202 [Ensete ventricosum]|uniref:Uncharacterized protein n=1 Tax=Ensete ventricosum TaxID=4639 RepID=A0A427B8M4_ENSVE|nr:hypothetical protein B296_00003202 [Ensete ventricosum]
MLRSLLALLLSAILLSSKIRFGSAHEHHGEEAGGSCESSPDVRVAAEFRPGVITVDGHADDWTDIEASEFALLPALDFDADKAYGGGRMSVRVSIFFLRFFALLLDVKGDYW